MTRDPFRRAQLAPRLRPAQYAAETKRLILGEPEPPCPRCGSPTDRCLCGPEQLAAWLVRTGRAS